MYILNIESIENQLHLIYIILEILEASPPPPPIGVTVSDNYKGNTHFEKIANQASLCYSYAMGTINPFFDELIFQLWYVLCDI